jgi:hypothetical protein
MSNETQNDDFRARLISDPAGAIEETIGVPLSTLPRPINVKFVEKEAGVDAVLVLPDFAEAGELSDSELEAVAGGVAQTELAADDCSLTCVCTACCLTSM